MEGTRPIDRLVLVLQADANTQALLDVVEERAAIGLWQRSLKSGEVYLSPGFRRMLGYSEHDLPSSGDAFEALIHPDDFQAAKRRVHDAYESHALDFEVEARLRHKNGTYRWVLSRGVITRDENGKPVKTTGIHIDVHEKKQVEESLRRADRELKRSNEELKRFAFVVSHDLKEPLRTIANYVQILERRYSSIPELNAHKEVGYITDGVKRAYSLINSLLRYASAGAALLEATEVDLNLVVKDALASLKFSIEETHAEVEVAPLPKVRADETLMRQLFQNLLSNALTYRVDGKVPRIGISTMSVGDRHVISVRDNGKGIPKEHAERIFGLFERLKRGPEGTGTGIGLATCRKIVERHGGEIWVDSTAQDGTTFSFSIPN